MGDVADLADFRKRKDKERQEKEAADRDKQQQAAASIPHLEARIRGSFSYYAPRLEVESIYELHRIDPDNTVALVGLGLIHHAQEQHLEALGYFDRVLALPFDPVYAEDRKYAIMHKLVLVCDMEESGCSTGENPRDLVLRAVEECRDDKEGLGLLLELAIDDLRDKQVASHIYRRLIVKDPAEFSRYLPAIEALPDICGLPSGSGK